MKKKGVSPLIAWVLLIGFSIATALVVTNWAIDQFSNVKFPQNREGDCDNVQIELEEFCIWPAAEDKVRINLSNKGYFTIKRLTMGRATSKFSEEWCTLLNLNLEPDNITTLNFTAGSKNSDYTDIRETDCDIDLGGTFKFNLTHNITKIEIVPWIEISDKSFHCVEKEILLNNITELNTICN